MRSVTSSRKFRVLASAEPQALPRLIGLIAQIGLTPTSLCAKATGDLITITIDQSGLNEQQAAVIAEKMRSLVLVLDVQLSSDQPSLDPLTGCAPSIV
ncbi:hypothetical protein [Novosphingobium resinovorum]|uniref:hypothetical protein n=1 Tax=Novosphingobium resinovorum TaxID=158500 RepID=UPI0012DF1041|nr:hypothetical protein [Novosphingobium resinovorum]